MRRPQAATASPPRLAGGDIANFAALESAARYEVAGAVGPDTLEAWLRNYGTEYRTLAKLASVPGQADPDRRFHTVIAEITHAVAEEMAMHCRGCDSEAHQPRVRLASGRLPPSSVAALGCSP